MLKFNQISESNFECILDLEELYDNDKDLQKFESKWADFLNSDESNPKVLRRKKNVISYPHKSWVPRKKDDRPSLFILAGNPATHSVLKDVYYSYEGKGIEHRFWKVMRELGFMDLYGTDPDIKDKFMNVNYASPFRVGMEAIFTFPSTPSKPIWSGIMGLEKLFGKKDLYKIFEIEKQRVHSIIKDFFKDTEGRIIAMQKDAYNSLASDTYSIKKAQKGELKSSFKGIEVIGTPPTRWLHTNMMKHVLRSVRITK